MPSSSWNENRFESILSSFLFQEEQVAQVPVVAYNYAPYYTYAPVAPAATQVRIICT